MHFLFLIFWKSWLCSLCLLLYLFKPIQRKCFFFMNYLQNLVSQMLVKGQRSNLLCNWLHVWWAAGEILGNCAESHTQQFSGVYGSFNIPGYDVNLPEVRCLRPLGIQDCIMSTWGSMPFQRYEQNIAGGFGKCIFVPIQLLPSVSRSLCLQRNSN